MLVLPTQCTYENLGHNEAHVIISNGIYGYCTAGKHQACPYIYIHHPAHVLIPMHIQLHSSLGK